MRLMTDTSSFGQPNNPNWLDSSPVCTKIVDGDLNLQYMSLAGIEGLGIEDINPFYGKPYPFDFYPEHFRQRMTTTLEQARQAGQPGLMEGSVVDLDGQTKWYESSISPIRDHEGRFKYFIVVSVETTARHRAESALQFNQTKLQALASELVLAEERERKRIAIHLHEDVCQNLTYSKMMLQVAAETSDSDKQSELLQKADGALDQVMSDVRSLSFELSAPNLSELGLETVISHLLNDRIKSEFGIATIFNDDGQNKPLADDTQALLLRSVRELLTNVVKHSQASQVEISISRKDDQISIFLRDNGIGFDTAKSENEQVTHSLGLFSIRERMALLGGSFEINTSPGSGCETTLHAPLNIGEPTDSGQCHA
jgi:PAS domain S-box-containing protein